MPSKDKPQSRIAEADVRGKTPASSPTNIEEAVGTADRESISQSNHAKIGRDSGEARAAATLIRGMRVLEAFKASDDGPLPNGEVAKRTGLPKATVSRLVHALADMGYIAIDNRTGGYSLASRVLSFAHVFLSRLDVRAQIRPLMHRLSAPSGTTVLLAMPDRLQMTTIEAMEADPRFQLRAWVGASVPMAKTASGHAYIAGLPEERRSALMEKLRDHYAEEWTVISKNIERSIQSIQINGYCLEVGEWKSNINDVAVPVVLDQSGDTVISFVCGGPPKLLPVEKLEELGREMAESSSKLQRLFSVSGGF
jgi:DNA-binding IclR family transcriptional regulator